MFDPDERAEWICVRNSNLNYLGVGEDGLAFVVGVDTRRMVGQ